MPSLLGTKINELRRARGLTLDQLAQATGSSKSYMWEIENKEVARPSAEKLERIAVALRVTPGYLMDASQIEPGAEIEDTAYYRKFMGLKPEAKATLKKIIDALDE